MTRLKQRGCEACAQKNWAPLVFRGELHAEVSIEPRVVVSVDLEGGASAPVADAGANASSFAPAAALQAATGAKLHGGLPSLRVALPDGRQAYLGPAHFNRLLDSEKRALRLYYHVFYLFAARPPFAPRPRPPLHVPDRDGDDPVRVGHALVDDATLLVSFGEQDCEARRAPAARRRPRRRGARPEVSTF